MDFKTALNIALIATVKFIRLHIVKLSYDKHEIIEEKKINSIAKRYKMNNFFDNVIIKLPFPVFLSNITNNPNRIVLI